MLLTKQTQLVEFLKTNHFQSETQDELISVVGEEKFCVTNVETTNSDIEVIEEYLYDNDAQELENDEYEMVIEVQEDTESVDPFTDTKRKDLVELIEEIEQRNKTIVEGSSFTPPKASRNTNTQQVVGRTDTLKMEKFVPKLILGLKADDEVEVLYAREYSCDSCPETFIAKSQLRYHSNLVHFTKLAKTAPISELPGICHICQKVLKNKKSLSVHLRTHDSTKKFPCLFAGCKKGFNMKVFQQIFNNLLSY